MTFLHSLLYSQSTRKISVLFSFLQMRQGKTLHLWWSQRFRYCFVAPLMAAADSCHSPRGTRPRRLFIVSSVQSEDQRGQTAVPVIIDRDGSPGLLDSVHLHLPLIRLHMPLFSFSICVNCGATGYAIKPPGYRRRLLKQSSRM